MPLQSGRGVPRWVPAGARSGPEPLRPCRISPLNVSIVWQLTQVEEEEEEEEEDGKATGTTKSWKDECSASSAPSGGAPDLFEWSSNLIRSQRAYLFS